MADKPEPNHVLQPLLLARAAVGGALMGLANLVPGISGGTMLVAAGVYRRFIDAVSEVTRLRLRTPSLVMLGVVVGSALVSIVMLSGVISYGLAEFRWGMYALFIGLTLGGAPLLWKLARPATPAVWGGVVCGALIMGGLVWVQSSQTSGASSGGTGMLVLAGAAGASAMILPGVSGAYLLLLLGQYRPIIEAIRGAKDGASAGDLGAVMDQMGVIIPVGIGVVLGVVVVANLLQLVLHRFEKATLGVLLGLLLAAPLGLYPFKAGVAPVAGQTVDGVVLTDEAAAEIEPKDWPEERFTPAPVQIGGAFALILLGGAFTLGIARLGRDRDQPADLSDLA